VKATQPHADAEWTIEGAEVGQVSWADSMLFDAETRTYEVTLVAHIVSIQSQATNRIIGLDDGTGRVEARCWVDSTAEDETEKWAGIE
jgi:replication factor A2